MKSLVLAILTTCLIFSYAITDSEIVNETKPLVVLDELSQQTLNEALERLKLRPDELGFDKMWVQDDTFKLAIVSKALSDPLFLAPFTDSLYMRLDRDFKNPYKMLKDIAELLQVTDNLKFNFPQEESYTFNPQAPFLYWKSALEQAEPLRKKFYANLTKDDLHDLFMYAPYVWSGASDSADVQYEFGKWQREFGIEPDTSRKVDTDRFLDIVKKVDVTSMVYAAMIVVPAAQQLTRHIASKEYEFTPIDMKIDGIKGEILWYEETQWGSFIIGGKGSNTYDLTIAKDISLIVDLGGDDIYRGRVAGAIGEIGNAYSLLIDLEGDDYYDSGNLDVAQGAGFLGIGILIDRSGNDTYRSGAYSQGAGFFGIGFHVDHGGADDRRGKHFMQGAGNCGVGILIDEGDSKSDDRYMASTWAQGFGSTFGLGLLIDIEGDDIYRAGAVHKHAPLLPNDYQSFSAGFGMGFRPRAAGGIGILYDKGKGTDFYDQEVMSLGSSYWYSLGILIDGGGNDHYSLAHYGLGVGIHLSAGLFWDQDGDDQYRARMGVVGGTPHDLSVGMFIEESGTDFYMVPEGWGGSLTNSFGLFIDKQGDDTYGTRGVGISLGNVRYARGFAGVAIFMDLEGNDIYLGEKAPKDSSIWMQGGWGIGIDLPRKEKTLAEKELEDTTPTAEDSLKSVEELFNLASQWEVGSARHSVAVARKALIGKGEDAVKYAIEKHIKTRDALTHRLLTQIMEALPDESGPLLIAELKPATKSKDERYLINVVSLLSHIKWKESIPYLVKLLDRKELERQRNTIISALGQLGDSETAKHIHKHLESKLERRRLASVGALGSLKNNSSIYPMIKLLDDNMFTVRSAVMVQMPNFGIDAIQPLIEFLNNPNSKYPEGGAVSLALIASNFKKEFDKPMFTTEEDSTLSESEKTERQNKRDKEIVYNTLVIKSLGDCLTHNSTHVRAEAVRGLYRVGDTEMRKRLDALMVSEQDTVVLAAYQQIQLEVNN